jgi:hypothetical protein
LLNLFTKWMWLEFLHWYNSAELAICKQIGGARD